jgi:hypothetical protein
MGRSRAIGEIPADLPDLQQGQVFRARIQEVLPGKHLQGGLVAGRSLTLSLPEGAKAGDTLELVVVDRTPRAIVARSVAGTAAPGEPYQQARLSSAGQLIAALLPREGDTAVPVALTRGRPVLAQVPASATEMARMLPAQLAQAVGSSGLFYEAHQVQWVLGQWPRSRLLTEPQGEYSRDGARAGWVPLSEEASPQESALAARRPNTNSGQSAPTLLQTLFGGGATAAATAVEEASQQASQSATRMIPEDLRPLVQQQLEAAATQRLAWHGEIWPRQEMDWEIRRDAPQRDDASAGEPSWNTNLRLTLPRLGEIEVRVQLSGQTLRLDLQTGKANSEADLRLALPSLRQALAAAGLDLLDARTSHGQA